MAATPPSTRARLSIFDRGLMVLCFIGTAATTSIFAFIQQDQTAQCQAVRSQRLADVEHFRTVAIDFEPLVDTYMGDALHGLDTRSSKSAVELNLKQQRSRLAYVMPYLDKEGLAKADAFNEAVVNFIVAADKSPTGVETRNAYAQLSKIFSGTRDLIAASNRATGMANINITSGRFLKRTFNCGGS